MSKKIIAAFVAVTIMFSPIGNMVIQDLQQTEVSAKKYRSGSKSFNNNTNTTTTPNQNVKNQNDTVNNRTNATTTKNNNSGGLMRGIMYGGIAGLLFGGLLAGMGGLGSIFGMLINIIGIIVLFMLISRVIAAVKKKRQEANDPWQR